MQKLFCGKSDNQIQNPVFCVLTHVLHCTATSVLWDCFLTSDLTWQLGIALLPLALLASLNKLTLS